MFAGGFEESPLAEGCVENYEVVVLALVVELYLGQGFLVLLQPLVHNLYVKFVFFNPCFKRLFLDLDISQCQREHCS